MPNIGRPSRDCHECRRRRVKCDLRRPECERCTKVGKRCPGYRDETSILFRNEDISSLAGPSASRDRRRSKTEEGSETEHSGTTTPQHALPLPPVTETNPTSTREVNFRPMDAMIMRQGWHSPPPRMLPEQWDIHAVPLVLSMLSAQMPDGSRYFGQAEFLPAMLSRQSDEAPLILCCKALGLAFLANNATSETAVNIRDHAYGQALAAANSLVGDSILCREDEAPVGVWLLSLYEVVTGPHTSTSVTIPNVTWSIHAQGLLELIRMRGPEQLQTPTGRNIFWIAVLSTQIRSLTAGVECPLFIKTWVDDLEDQSPTMDADLVRMNNVAYAAASLSARICQRLGGPPSKLLPIDLDSLWAQVQALQALFDQAIYDYPLGNPIDLKRVHLCNMYRAYYMRMLQFLIDMLYAELLQPEISADHNKINALIDRSAITIRSLATDTIQTIPYILEHELSRSISTGGSAYQPAPNRSVCWADVLRLLWPLRFILACRHLVNGDEVRTVENALQKISTGFCIRQATAISQLNTTRTP